MTETPDRPDVIRPRHEAEPRGPQPLATQPEPRPVAWAISGGARGMENQALALAEAAGFDARPLRLSARAPWRWLPEAAWPLWGDVARRLAGTSDPIDPPWPALVVACGRLSVPAAIHIRRRAQGRTFVVQCQNPRIAPRHFDLVVPPEHDAMPAAGNVLPILGAPNLALPWRLAEARSRWAPVLAHLPRPLIAVAIGGSSRAFTMTPAALEALFARLAAIREATGAGFAVTASRRTGAAAEALVRRETERLGGWLWEGTGASPILGLYALADAVVVTADSVNMAAEAAAAGTPVLVAPLDGGTPKFSRFHEALRQRGIARPLDGVYEPWTYTPLDETRRAAEAIRTRMMTRGLPLPPPRDWSAIPPSQAAPPPAAQTD